MTHRRRDTGAPVAHRGLLRHVVEVDHSPSRPATMPFALQDHTVLFAVVELLENVLDLVLRELAGRLGAPACEHLVGMMMVVMMLVVVLIVVVMVMLVLVLIVIVMMVVTTAGAVLVMLFMVVMVVMVVLVLGLLGKELQLLFKGILVLHRLENLCAGELIPRVVMMVAFWLCSRNRATQASSFSA